MIAISLIRGEVKVGEMKVRKTIGNKGTSARPNGFIPA